VTDENIPCMDTTTSSWSDTKTYFKYGKLILMLFHQLLPNDLIIVRSHGDDEEDVWDTKDILESPRDVQHKVDI
jgi:hypothetical protein